MSVPHLRCPCYPCISRLNSCEGRTDRWDPTDRVREEGQKVLIDGGIGFWIRKGSAGMALQIGSVLHTTALILIHPTVTFERPLKETWR